MWDARACAVSLWAGFFAEGARTGSVVAECGGWITAVACAGAPVDVVDGRVGAAAPVAVDVTCPSVFVAVATTGADAADVVAVVSSTVFVTAFVTGAVAEETGAVAEETGAVAEETGAGALGAFEVADVVVVTAFVTGVVAVAAAAGAAEVSVAGDAVESASAQAGPEKVPATTSAATNGRKRDARRA